MSWYPAALPDQTGRRHLVTGANRGLGFFTAARLVGAGAHVVMAGRSAARVDAAAAAIRTQVAAGAARGETSGEVETLVLDTASLDSVAAAAETVLAGPPLDGLVLNAGVVHTPRTRETSIDGHELVLATNTLGHFALHARLHPHLAAGARIVTIGSLSTMLSTFRVDDLELERGYDSWRAYAQSKIANQSLAFELDRRFRASGSDAASLVAHPGYAITGRTPFVPGVNEPGRRQRLEDALQAFIAQGKHRGAEPVLHALTAPDAEGGRFWGPRFATKGAPALARPTRTSSDPEVAARVWAFAEQATGTRHPLTAQPVVG